MAFYAHFRADASEVVGVRQLRVVVGVAVRQVGVPRIGDIVRYRSTGPVVTIDARR
jgi:hypothetical protein